VFAQDDLQFQARIQGEVLAGIDRGIVRAVGDDMPISKVRSQVEAGNEEKSSAQVQPQEKRVLPVIESAEAADGSFSVPVVVGVTKPGDDLRDVTAGRDPLELGGGRYISGWSNFLGKAVPWRGESESQGQDKNPASFCHESIPVLTYE
jgi:hypothetical protein